MEAGKRVVRCTWVFQKRVMVTVYIMRKIEHLRIGLIRVHASD